MKKLVYISGMIFIIGFLSLIFPNNKVEAYTEEEYTQKLNESVAYAMSLLDDDMTDHEKAFILAQYCQEGNVYLSNSKDQYAEGVLVDHKAVCAGYAQAFRLLCTTAGLPCENIISPKYNHEFNICYLDGEWSYVDITRGMSGAYDPEGFSGEVFEYKDQIDNPVLAKKPDGSTTYTTAAYAKENGWEILESKRFSGAGYRYEGLNNNYFPEGTDRSSEFNFTSNFSRIYYDENYKYYEQRELNSSHSYIYKENRNTGERTTLVEAFTYDYSMSGMVKDNNKIYYIGTDGKTIYSMDLNGNNNTKEFTYTGTDRVISGIFVQDGYINYVLREAETSTKSEWVKWKKLDTAISTGTYTLNDSQHKYKLNYIQTSKGIVISSCEGIGGEEPSGNLYIPDKINGLPVIGIGNYAFDDLSLTGELTLPSNLEYIGTNAFNNTDITKIKFDSKIKSVGRQAFNFCQNLKGTLEMSDSILYIGEGAFSDCYYDKIHFSDNLVMISGSAFSWNRDLDGVIEIPEGVVSIGNSAFAYTRLDAAILPTTLENLGEKAFRDYLSDNDFKDIAIKSEKMKSFYESSDYTIYLMSGTETSKYADENNIPYEDLRTAKPNIRFKESNIKLPMNSVTKQIEYTVTPEFFKGYEMKWSSSNKNVATVDENGIIAPIQAGTSTISLSINGVTNNCTVVVEKAGKKGDVNKNGEVELYDVLMILKQSILDTKLDDEMLYIMDYNDDEEVELFDALKFLQQVILS